jgi:aspartate carbamoyltransferase
MNDDSLRNKHIVSIAGFEPAAVEKVFEVARDMRSLVEKKGASSLLSGRIMATLFYEPSSRTYGSFVSAMQRLGGGVIPLQSMEHSSVVKGETFEDTIATFGKLADVIVLRHAQEGSASKAATISSVPVINAGDGADEHPTQALLDVFTMHDHFADFSKIRITLVGDLLYGRTVHSLIQLLGRYKPVEIRLVSPKELRMPSVLVEKLEQSGVALQQTDQLQQVIGDTDVLYMTRVQKERFADVLEYERLKDSFQVTDETMKLLKKESILMHPFPRVHEISPSVDQDPRALYIREQIPNGLYVRMALLSMVLAS